MALCFKAHLLWGGLRATLESQTPRVVTGRQMKTSYWFKPMPEQPSLVDTPQQNQGSISPSWNKADKLTRDVSQRVSLIDLIMSRPCLNPSTERWPKLASSQPTSADLLFSFPGGLTGSHLFWFLLNSLECTPFYEMRVCPIVELQNKVN